MNATNSIPLIPSIFTSTLAVILLIAATAACVNWFLKTTRRKAKTKVAVIASAILLPILLLTVICSAISIPGYFRAKAADRILAERGAPDWIGQLDQSRYQKGGNAAHFFQAASDTIRSIGLFEQLGNFMRTDREIGDQASETWVTRDERLSEWVPDSETIGRAFPGFYDPKFNDALDLFKKAAQQEYLTYNRYYSGDAWQMPVPEVGWHKPMARLIDLHAAVLAANGDRKAAYELLLQGLKINRLYDEPLIVATFVRISSDSCYLKRIAFLSREYGIENETAQRLITQIQAMDYQTAMKYAIDCDRIMLQEAGFNQKVMLNEGERMPLILRFSPFIGYDYARMIQRCEVMRNALDQPFWLVYDALIEFEETVPWYAVVTKSVDYMRVAVRLVARIESDSQATILSLALAIYRNTHGTYPQTIEELAPTILPAISANPLTGQPFKYSRVNDGYELSGGAEAPAK